MSQISLILSGDTMQDVSAIKNYVLFLKNCHGLSVTLHPIKNEALINSSELISFNIHDNSYCVYLKSCEALHNHCVKKQKKILENLEKGSFCGTCHAGVKEYIYPISNGRENVGFISVSGYKTENADSYIKKISSEYGFDYKNLKEIYSSLSDTIPERDEIDTLIIPLCKMLELAYIKGEDGPQKEESLPEKIVKYIKRHRNSNITSEDICRRFSCSRSYMSARFNEFTGKSLREYITELRIADAKLLLLNSSLTVTEIALSVGFSDSNYFSVIFKKHTGMSPLKFKSSAN